MSQSIVIFDAADRSVASSFWRPGAALWRVLGRATSTHGVRNIEEMLDVLVQAGKQGPISQVEVWCHGYPGGFQIGDQGLGVHGLRKPAITDALQEIGLRISEANGVFWIRACSSFAGPMGHAFAADLCYTMGCRVAGHTMIIGPFQAGCHTLEPSQAPYWDTRHGYTEKGGWGSAVSRLDSDRNVPAWVNRIPQGW